MQEVAAEYYTFTTNDLTPVILKLKNANPDILHHIARNQDAILFWRQAREQNSPGQGRRACRRDRLRLARASARPSATTPTDPSRCSSPGPGFVIEKMRPEGQRIERAFRDAVKAKTGADVLRAGISSPAAASGS